MAMLRIMAAEGPWSPLARIRRLSPRRRERARHAQPRRHVTALRTIFTGPLPADVGRHECSVATLFRASIALNYMTGGAPDMTFSARCHRTKRTGRSPAARAGWSLLAMAIDAGCGVLRGECEHCATAWANHVTRPRHTPL